MSLPTQPLVFCGDNLWRGSSGTSLPDCFIWCIPVPVSSDSWKDKSSGTVGFLLALPSHTSHPPICPVISSNVTLPLLSLLPFHFRQVSTTVSGQIRYLPRGCCSQRLLRSARNFCYPRPSLLAVTVLAGPVTSCCQPLCMSGLL